MKLGLMVAAVTVGLAVAGLQAFGQGFGGATGGPERFNTLDFTNSGFLEQYQGAASIYPLATNAGGFQLGSNTVPVAGGSTANWFDVSKWYNVPVTFSAGVSVGPQGTNGNLTLQLHLATDLGGSGSPPQPGINPVPPTVTSNAFFFIVPEVGGITNYAVTNVPAAFFTNYHWACWSAFINNATNTWTTNSAGFETNCPRLQKFRAQWKSN